MKDYEVQIMPARMWEKEAAFGTFWLESKTTDDILTYLFVIDEIQIDLIKTGSSSNWGVTTKAADSRGEVDSQKKMYTAFFTDGTAFMAGIKETQRKMFVESLGKMAAYLTIGTILLILLGYWRAKSIAQKMTKQVVSLYENLNEISQKSKGQSGKSNVVELSYVPACKEMNALNLTYN